MSNGRGIANSLITDFVALDEEWIDEHQSVPAENDLEDEFTKKFRRLWQKDLANTKKEMEKDHKRDIARVEAQCKAQLEELKATKAKLDEYIQKEKDWERQMKDLLNENEKLKKKIRELCQRPTTLRRRRRERILTPQEAIDFANSEEARLLKPEIEKLPESKKWGWKAIAGAIVIIAVGAGLCAAGGVGIAVLALEGGVLLTAALAGTGGAVGAAVAASGCYAVNEKSSAKTKC